MKIRNAKKDDAEKILNLLYEMGRPKAKNKEEFKNFIIKIQKYILCNDKKIFVAEENNKIIGCVCVIFIPKLNQIKPELYITELVVTKKMRGVGIGKELISKCKEIAEKKCFRIRLESGHKRKEAHRFYKKLNFNQSALTYTMNF